MVSLKRPFLSVGSLLLASTSSLWAQVPEIAGVNGPQTIKVTLHGSAIIKPVLAQQLMPPLSEQQPGNAAVLYMMAGSSQFTKAATHDDLLKADDFAVLPLDKLPAAEAQKSLDLFAIPLGLIEDAGRRQDVEWDTSLREHGYYAVLPYLNTMRSLSNILGLQAHLQMARGDWAGAQRTLQTKFAMAHHLNNHPVLIQALVEAGMIEGTINRDLWTWICQPKSPNLYWAVSSLPHPFFDSNAIAQWEQAELACSNPQIALALKEQLPADQYQAVLEQILPMVRTGEGNDNKQKVTDIPGEVRRLIGANQSAARQYLASAGLPQKQVEAMPAAQAVGIFFFRQYRELSDELWKGWQLPYPQSAAAMAPVQKQLTQLQQSGAGNPLLETLPTLSRARLVLARTEWHLEVIRVIEALRDYAAHHDAKAPSALDQITDLPVPMDPATGKAFAYHLEGQTAILEAPRPGGGGYRFEITLAK